MLSNSLLHRPVDGDCFCKSDERHTQPHWSCVSRHSGQLVQLSRLRCGEQMYTQNDAWRWVRYLRQSPRLNMYLPTRTNLLSADQFVILSCHRICVWCSTGICAGIDLGHRICIAVRLCYLQFQSWISQLCWWYAPTCTLFFSQHRHPLDYQIVLQHYNTVFVATIPLNPNKSEAAFFGIKPCLRKPGLPSSIFVARCPIALLSLSLLLLLLLLLLLYYYKNLYSASRITCHPQDENASGWIWGAL